MCMSAFCEFSAVVRMPPFHPFSFTHARDYEEKCLTSSEGNSSLFSAASEGTKHSAYDGAVPHLVVLVLVPLDVVEVTPRHTDLGWR